MCQSPLFNECSSFIAARIKRSSAIVALLAADRDLLGQRRSIVLWPTVPSGEAGTEAHKRFIDRWASRGFWRQFHSARIFCVAPSRVMPNDCLSNVPESDVDVTAIVSRLKSH